MNYFCCDQRRRNAIRGAALNGIDYLEVIDHEAPPGQRQRLLEVHFVNDLAPGALAASNILIEGGERIRPIVITNATTGAGPEAKILTVEVEQAGDFSIYTLRLVQDALHTQPPDGFDPMLAAVEFSFKVECPSEFDCKPARVCPPEPSQPLEIDYLAKDYASFRRLLLDRMAVLMPQWRERNPADLGIALVELLAYAGDYLSYQQDAVATEAYLGTARRRVSVRRHALLVDYPINDGCNARAWVQLQVSADVVKLLPTDSPILPIGTLLLTRIAGQAVRLPNDPMVLRQSQAVFETMEEVNGLFASHNEILFYTWGDQRCCLPKGATYATLKGHFQNLKNGEVLILEEILGPRTGEPEDADPGHRHAVRLTEVIHTDENGDPLVDPLNNQEITAIRWSVEDALPVPFCISAITDAEHGKRYIEDVSVARGNIVLADHGRTIANEFLGKVPEPKIFNAPTLDKNPCEARDREAVFPRFRPSLKERPLTQAGLYDASASAHAAFHWDTKKALPKIFLQSRLNADMATWEPQRDLLNSGPDAKKFVVEIEIDGTAYLRFGDDKHGVRPEPETEFRATYRVGNGVAGNIGAEALAHIVANIPEIISVRNPLPAQGGAEPESGEDVRQRAPSAFRTQERAVTPEDYASVTERHAEVQRAAATFRWTGSWHTVFLTVDRAQGLAVDNTFETKIRQHVERYRMAGYDLEVDAPLFVSLEIVMRVCAKPDYFRSEVKAALLEVFSNHLLPDGRRGLFHPDNFTFGQPVFLSRLYAAAQAVPGVASVQITKFQRQGITDQTALNDGKLLLNRLEIARLDNDPNFVEHGIFTLHVGGGK